jgi:hypothetical protein
MIRARIGAMEFVQTVLRLQSNAKEFAFIAADRTSIVLFTEPY